MMDLTVERAGPHDFIARNGRGATVRVGRTGAPGAFTPGELLQLAAAACAAITTEELVTRRAGPDARIVAEVDHERAAGAREYQALRVRLRADLSFLDDSTRERVVHAMRIAVERQCTVSRTVERGAPVRLTIDTGTTQV
ncbi:OsmC family protein [Actinoplanes siamensis]|uniref:Osmotically inducible protein C n=1 Tax=Actinoplanes siamensis TaxID=1223317 RepID=A0A919N611_9ACTN|nr:OsmC family protein [Actinoplanes siamensis]GIF04979.1 osmotically inducible protein C [Actinoplanes siamensis]